jgi:hypothetical protein
MIGYHFLREDFRSGEGNEPPWEIGEERIIAGPENIALCRYGYHFSRTLWEALTYARGPIATQVEVPDDSLYDTDKGVAVRRRLIKAVNIDRELRLFACDCAECVLHIYERKHSGDVRPQNAIDTARRFANKQATREELAAARAAARAAAWDAERAWQRKHFDVMFGGIFQ